MNFIQTAKNSLFPAADQFENGFAILRKGFQHLSTDRKLKKKITVLVPLRGFS